MVILKGIKQYVTIVWICIVWLLTRLGRSQCVHETLWFLILWNASAYALFFFLLFESPVSEPLDHQGTALCPPFYCVFWLLLRSCLKFLIIGPLLMIYTAENRFPDSHPLLMSSVEQKPLHLMWIDPSYFPLQVCFLQSC